MNVLDNCYQLVLFSLFTQNIHIFRKSSMTDSHSNFVSKRCELVAFVFARQRTSDHSARVMESLVNASIDLILKFIRICRYVNAFYVTPLSILFHDTSPDDSLWELDVYLKKYAKDSNRSRCVRVFLPLR